MLFMRLCLLTRIHIFMLAKCAVCAITAFKSSKSIRGVFYTFVYSISFAIPPALLPAELRRCHLRLEELRLPVDLQSNSFPPNQGPLSLHDGRPTLLPQTLKHRAQVGNHYLSWHSTEEVLQP